MRWGAYGVVLYIYFFASTLFGSVHAQNTSVTFSQVIRSNLSVEYQLFARSMRRLEISLSNKNLASKKIIFLSNEKAIKIKDQENTYFLQERLSTNFIKWNVVKKSEKHGSKYYCVSCRSG